MTVSPSDITQGECVPSRAEARPEPRAGERSRPPHSRRTTWRAIKDKIARTVSGALGVGILLLVVAVAVVLLLRTLPLLTFQPVWNLLTGQVWEPHNGLFGFAPFIAGSITVTVVAMALAVVPAVLSGVYLAEHTSLRARAVIKPMLDLLVGLPSVVIGLWGVLVIVPFIRDFAGPTVGDSIGQVIPWLAFTNPSGYSVLAAGIVLGIMVFPLIAAVVDEVLRSAPQEMREALLSLGATKWEATRCVVRRRGLPGIIAAVVLGFSRAFGETLAVLMVVGNVVRIPGSVFDAAYSLPALIANNYGEMMSVPLYESALMGAALLLLVTVIIFNVAARAVIVRLGKEA